MKAQLQPVRTALTLSALLGFSALVLSACGASSGSPTPDGGRPPLPTGVEVRFPAAPPNAYLNLLNSSGESVYQLSVPAGATGIAVDPAKWAAQSSKAAALEGLLPATASGLNNSATDVKVALLEWLMWQDKNTNGTRDLGEALPLMTHDRVAYSDKAFTLTFDTATPKTRQQWRMAAGWQRAEHYVYLPKGTDTYQRLFESAGVQRYVLHEPTPVTSQ